MSLFSVALIPLPQLPSVASWGSLCGQLPAEERNPVLIHRSLISQLTILLQAEARLPSRKGPREG